MKTILTQFVLTLFAMNALAQELEFERTGYRRELSYLASVQNSDGSWGNNTGRVYETAFAVLAFLNHGATPSSLEYGSNVQRSLEWLMRQNPTNHHDRVSLVHALVATYEITRIPILKEEAARHNKEIDRDQLKGEWALLYEITAQPGGEPTSRRAATRALREFTIEEKEASPLSLYLETLAMFLNGPDSWMKHLRKALIPLIKGQANDGSYDLGRSANEVEATAFAILRINVYYRFWVRYLNVYYPDLEVSEVD